MALDLDKLDRSETDRGLVRVIPSHSAHWTTLDPFIECSWSEAVSLYNQGLLSAKFVEEHSVDKVAAPAAKTSPAPAGTQAAPEVADVPAADKKGTPA